MVMRAATRNFPWKDISSELIDNALANTKDDLPCQVLITWDSSEREFSVIDHGAGSTDIESFFRPGKTGGNHGRHGNSTFGTGLFAIECYLDGQMQVATEREGAILVAERSIGKSSRVVAEELMARNNVRRGRGLPERGGTRIRFRKFRKRVPSRTELDRIVSHLSFAYSTALERGDLVLSIRLNGKLRRVRAAKRPAVHELYTQTLEHEGHAFEVEWGVTHESVRDVGCWLIYGGKTFDVTPRPCGKGRLSRFHAALRIPRSAGLKAMDLLKKSAEREFLDPVFRRCNKLFQRELREADRLCGDDLNRLISDAISQLLSRQRVANRQNGHKPPAHPPKPLNGQTQIDPRGLDDPPPRPRRAPDSVIIDWVGFGRPVPLARYDPKSKRLSYNEDNDTLTTLRSESKVYELACVAAGYIAYEIDKLDPQFRVDMGTSMYDEVYRKLIERASIQALMQGQELSEDDLDLGPELKP